MNMMEIFLKTQLMVTVTVFWNVMSCSLYITANRMSNLTTVKKY